MSRMRGAEHYAVRKGKRVIVWFRDGPPTVDRFVRRDDDVIVLERLGVVPLRRVRTLSYYKGDAEGMIGTVHEETR